MRARRTLPFLAAATAVAACSSSTTAPLPREGPPSALRVSFSGFGFGSHDVWLERGDTLRVVRRTWERAAAVESTTVVPTAAAWRAFWDSAREAGVGAWPRECIDRRIADGSGISVLIVGDGRTVEATGANAWPQGNGRCSATPELSGDVRTFLAAVGTLIGRRYPD